MKLRKLFFVLMMLLSAVQAARAGDEAPPWLQQLLSVKVPTYDKSVQAVVLLNEQKVKVNSDGRITIARSFAVRILTREGRSYAQAEVPYLTNSGKVQEMRAWLIKPSGETRRFGKDDIIDLISDPNDIYNEQRVKLISARDAADSGAIFGFQATTEEKTIFGQDAFDFQDELPTLTSRYCLTLPSQWTASSITFNHPDIKPQIEGGYYVWQLSNLEPIKDEPASPKVTNLAPRLAISYVSPQGSSGPLRTFSSWVDVSRFVSELQDPQALPNEAIAAKVRHLTANATTEFERIRAIGEYVQQLKYISISTNLGYGGGMIPHSAAEVFAKSYGDCKDKANLMRAMLKVLNIFAYPVAIYSGDRTYVREEWPSPQQFNHCIIAIKVSAETSAQTVIEHPNLGRLLIFDATDDNTPLGELPDHEEGSLALIVAGDTGGLMRMPVSLPEANGLAREIDATLNANGVLEARVKERASGAWAASYRSEYRQESRSDYLKIIEGWITRGATGAKVTKVEPEGGLSLSGFKLAVDFTAPGYGQLMQDRLLVFKPAIVSRRDSLFLTEEKRQYPIVLEALVFTETVRLKLPGGFNVDELPDPVKLDGLCGSYETKYEVTGDQLIFTRSLSQRAATLPPEKYKDVRNFFERIRAAEQAPVVLARM